MSLRDIGLALAGGFVLAACNSYDDSDPPPTVTFEIPPLVTSKPTVATPVAYNDIPVHDPSIERADDGTWYVIGSHLAMAKSSDLVAWESVADGVTDANPLFNTYSTEISEGIAWTGGHVGSWASDIIKLADGRWYFYYDHCATADDGLCDAPRSYLGVAVSGNIEGPYQDLGIFLYSGQTDAEITNGFGVGDITHFDGNIHPNVIDPALFYDKDGRLWMTYGSYSGGIFILEMDDTTGKPLAGQGYGKHLAGGFFSAIEGSYVLYSPESDYYYLFTSFGGFEADDGYNIRVARSRNPDGPYLDADGNDMAQAAGGWEAIEPFGVKLMGGFEFATDVGDSTPSRGYLSPGHNSAYYDEETGRYLLVTHTRFPNRGQEHALRVHEMFLNENNWLVVSPHRYAPLSGDNQVGREDIAGVYRFVNHEEDINRQAKRNVYISLNADRTISGDLTGTYRLSFTGGREITFNLDGLGAFEGIIAWQWDSVTQRLTPTFTALSDTGVAVWGSQMEPMAAADVMQSIADDLVLPETFQGDAIELPTVGTRGADITWTSDNPDVIKPDGTVIRPNVGDGDQTVGLTATITLNGEETTVTRFVTVPQRFTFNRMAQWDFESNLAESLGNFPAGEATGDRIFKPGGPVAYAAGHDGQALALDGTNGVRLPDGLISNYEYSVSFWANPAALTSFTTAFFGAVNEQQPDVGEPFSNSWISIVPQGWDGNTMLWSGSDPWFDGLTGELIAANAWSHLGFSVNRGLVKVFINGEEKFSGGNLTDFFTAAPGRFALGVNYWDLPFNGLIDELKVYDAALLAGEMKALDIDHVPSADLLQTAADLLDLGDLSALTGDFRLPRTGPFAAAIDWASSDPEAIAIVGDTGIVTRPAEGAPAANVTLTATLTLDGEGTTRQFAASIRPEGPPEPLARFSFEDNLDDSKGNFAAGTPTGALIDTTGGSVAFVAGVTGKALSLDGATGVALDQNLVADDTYSISLWLNPSVLTGYTTALFGGSNTSWISVVPGGLGTDGTGTTMLWSGEAWYDAVSGIRIPTGEWTHFAAVNHGGEITVYLDGVPMFTGSNFPDVFTPLVNPRFWIGVNYWDTAYKGLVDEIEFYDIALTDEDVARLYGQGSGG